MIKRFVLVNVNKNSLKILMFRVTSIKTRKKIYCFAQKRNLSNTKVPVKEKQTKKQPGPCILGRNDKQSYKIFICFSKEVRPSDPEGHCFK